MPWRSSSRVEPPQISSECLLGFGLGIEIIQAHLPYREFSLADLAADAAGIAIGLFPWPGIRKAGKPDLRNSPESL